MSGSRLTVHVQPRARVEEIVGYDDAGRLRVRVTAPPADGAANEAVERLIARTLGVPRRQVAIETGHASRTKIVRIDGIEADEVWRRLVG